MEFDRTLFIINLAIPLGIIALSIPLVFAKIPPNRWYGFRTNKTRSSDAVWYRANRLAGQYLIVAAVFQLVAIPAMLVFWPQLAPVLFAYGILALVPLLIALVMCFLRVRTF